MNKSEKNTATLSESEGIVNAYLRAWRQMGCPIDELLQRVGVDDQGDLANDAGRVPISTVVALFETACKLMQDPLLGLKTAQCMVPGDFGILGKIYLHSPDGMSAFKASQRYHSLVGDIASARLTRVGDNFCLAYSNPYFPISTQQIDYFFAITVQTMKMCGGGEARIKKIKLTHDGFGRQKEYKAFFDAPLEFGADENTIIVPESQVFARNPGYDAATYQQLTQIADTYLLEELDYFAAAEQVKRLLGKILIYGEVSREEIAGTLHCSVRTLQRRLKDEGTSYKEIYDEIRKDVAMCYIDNDDKSLYEIGLLLGFTETSAFYKAFKRWTGLSPGEYRRGALENRASSHY